MPITENPESTKTKASLRERVKQESEQLTVLPTAELLEKLTALPQVMNETAEKSVRRLEDASDRTARRLNEIVEATRQASVEMLAATNRLAELQKIVEEAERKVTYQVEKLKRQADRAQWMQTSVILLALAAGILGGIGAALVIVN